jgi:16S rRNA (cytosine1402-N4)-methyltransferase
VKSIHRPVLTEQVFELLCPAEEQRLMIDGTVGEGGHAELFLSRCPHLHLIGLDADGSILERAEKRLSPYLDRVELYTSWFNKFFKSYPARHDRPDIILLDLGISTYHYEESQRGFSFQKDELLDMRLDSSLETSAADIVNEYPVEELANLIFEYGEERYSRRIASAIQKYREEKAVKTAQELRDIIWNAVPAKYRHARIHPATRTFQALRIAVNGELARLRAGLSDGFSILKPGGRMGVISFHSLEDRMVKQFFKQKNQACTCPPEWPVCKCGGVRLGKIITKKPVVPGEEEKHHNRPSRSAKFRVIEKLQDEVL